MKQIIFLFLQTFKKNVLEHKIISSVVVIVVLSFSYYYFNKTSATVSYQYVTVKRGSLTSIVSSTGQVISNSQVDLKPKVNANVTGVYVRAGDRVHAGQILFRLDANNAYKQVRDAKTSLESAKIALEKLKNPKSIDVISIKNSIQQEEDSKKSEDQKVATAYRTLLTTGLKAVPDSTYTNETAPTITGSYTKTTEGQIKLNVYQGGVTGYSFTISGITSGSGQANTVVAQPISDTGLYIQWNSAIPQTNWIIDIPNKQSTSYATNYNSWQNAVTNRDIANTASDRTITSLLQKLADLTPPDTDLDVRSAMLQVEQRQNALYDAQESLADYSITAPFDGVMANVSVDIGASAVMASANSSSALGTIVTDKKLAQVILNESDIVKVHLGQKATMTFDAINDLTASGTVVEINTLGTVTSGVVTYKAKIAFNSDDPRILPNMSVSADIVTDSKDNILSVPNQAIKHDTDGYYVEKDISASTSNLATSTRRFNNTSSTRMSPTDGTSSGLASTTRKKMNTGSSSYTKNSTTNTKTSTTLLRIPVTIGLQNDTQTEITSGLLEGEKIILKKITSTISTTSSAPSITSLFRPQGGTRSTGVTPK